MIPADLHVELISIGAIESAPRSCQGSKFHNPTPYVVRPHAPYPGSREVWMCGTCWDNYEVIWKLLCAHEGHLSWDVYRRFGNNIRHLGARAWADYSKMLIETSVARAS